MDEILHTRGDILVVDDHPPSLQVLTAILSKQGHTIRAVMSGKMALTAAQTETPDLVLLDVKLPDMDGYEVCRQFKNDERLRGVPVIFISSPETTYDKIHAFEVGAVDYIMKPFQIDDVVARVESQLTLRRIYEQANIVAMIHERERLSRDLH
ncbi:MAG: response regulator, partial [Anaerolineae bacterium]|nr:response regulator [Anaerolineae bacterium]